MVNKFCIGTYNKARSQRWMETKIFDLQSANNLFALLIVNRFYCNTYALTPLVKEEIKMEFLRDRVNCKQLPTYLALCLLNLVDY
jgi:hypothetical protein